MYVMVGKLREDMERGDNAGEGILRHGCGRGVMPVPGGPYDRQRAIAVTLMEGCGRRTPLAPRSVQGVPWLLC
jgi:hypothetical protein